MKLERHLQEYLKKQSKKNRIDFYKMECVGRTGFPDVLLTFQGWTIFIELKSPSGTGRLTPRQLLMLAELIKADQETYVLQTKADIDKVIKNIAKRKSRPVYHAAL